MTTKASVLLGSLILLCWMALPIGSLATGDASWIVVWLFLAVFLFPFWWQVIVVVVGKDKLEEFPSTSRIVLMLAALTFIMGGIGVFSYQLYNYLKSGSWISISIIDSLLFLKLNWAANPQDWLGVWKILNYLPLSLALLIVGILALEVRARFE